MFRNLAAASRLIGARVDGICRLFLRARAWRAVSHNQARDSRVARVR